MNKKEERKRRSGDERDQHSWFVWETGERDIGSVWIELIVTETEN